MSKKDIDGCVKWPANLEAPLTREQQIELMTTSRDRHAARVERIKDLLKAV